MSVLRIDTARVFKPLLSPARYKGAYGGRGAMKCLGRGTRVVMFDGTLQAVESISVGDILLGIDGIGRNVLSVSSGIDDLYDIRQTTAGSYVANSAHILALEQSNSSISEGRYPMMESGLVSVSEFANSSDRFKSSFYGYKRPAIFAHNNEQPLDPYFVGAWLGDGDSARPALTTADPEIVKYIDEFAAMHDCRLSKFGKPDNKASGYLVARRNGSVQENPVTKRLRSLDLLNNKHLPQCYVTASEQQRLELLAGFIDTDGCSTNNGYVVYQSDEKLLRRFKFVADSLAFKTNLRSAEARCEDKIFNAWVLSIGGGVWRIPCKVGRKIIREGDASKNKDWRRTGIDAVAIGQGEFYGFQLDGDSLFFLDDFTVTHNSHFFSGLMIEESIMGPLDCVCLREHQKSLQFSVKKLLEAKIESMNAGSYFEVQDKRILAKQGGVIIFEGMQTQTAESIKSLEGFDRAWFEEAQTASQHSLDLLRPTIRKRDSEMWFSWNPEKKTDPVDVLLRGPEPPPGSIVVECSYRDNPWLPDELKAEIAYDQRRDPDKFAHIWLGQYQRNSEARVFRNWTVEEFERPPGTIHRLGADWGFSVDPSVLIRCDIEGNRLYVDYEAYMIGCEIVNLPDLFDRVPESRKWFITADSARPETISHMRNHGYPKINAAIKGPKSLEEGVEFLKSFDIVVHPRCVHTIDELSSYSYKLDPLTNQVLPILDDKKNHVIDSLRYACEAARRVVKPKPKVERKLVAGSWQT